jgi:hypothetical protein
MANIRKKVVVLGSSATLMVLTPIDPVDPKTTTFFLMLAMT